MIRVAKASLDEVSSMANIVVTTWKTAYKGIVSQSFLNKLSPKMYLERFKRAIRAPHILVLRATYQNEVVGVLQAQYDEPSNKVHIAMLYVLPNVQRMGVGKQLLQTCITTYTQSEQFVLDVLVGNHVAKQFYEKNGFSFNGHQRQADINGGVCYVEEGV